MLNRTTTTTTTTNKQVLQLVLNGLTKTNQVLALGFNGPTCV